MNSIKKLWKNTIRKTIQSKKKKKEIGFNLN